MNIKTILSKLFEKLTGNEVFYVNGAEDLPAPLSKSEEEEILAQIEAGDEKKRDILVTHNLRLVVYIAKKFENTGVGIEDLISIGTIGLIKAVNTFSPTKSIKLATYASRCIENEILMYLRKIAHSKTDISIDEPLKTDWDGNELLLCDVLGSDDDVTHREIEAEDERTQLLKKIKGLSEREQEILKLRFGLYGSDEYTQKEVADLLGISQSYISRLEKRIIQKLKRELEKV